MRTTTGDEEPSGMTKVSRTKVSQPTVVPPPSCRTTIRALPSSERPSGQRDIGKAPTITVFFDGHSWSVAVFPVMERVLNDSRSYLYALMYASFYDIYHPGHHS